MANSLRFRDPMELHAGVEVPKQAVSEKAHPQDFKQRARPHQANHQKDHSAKPNIRDFALGQE